MIILPQLKSRETRDADAYRMASWRQFGIKVPRPSSGWGKESP